MHEGLLIISKEEKEALFCNKMASKLLAGAMLNKEATRNTKIETM